MGWNNFDMTDRADAIGIKTATWSEDARIMGLVGSAHLVSHFFHLILAPLFPWLRTEFGFSYAQLGFLMTVFFVVSGGFQAVSGFIVDRYGAVRTLIAGLLSLSVSAAVLASSDDYSMLLIGAALAGLGNAVFHPVDFWLINHRISVPRLGPAYSAHGLSGSLGWAFAPVFLVGIATPFGWRTAVLAAAALPLIVIALLAFNRTALKLGNGGDPAMSGDSQGKSTFRFLRDPSTWWCFAFFLFISAALGGVQNFAPTIFMNAYGMAVTVATLSITIYMLSSALGMIAGGWLVMRGRSLERNITIALSLSAVGAVLVGLQIFSGVYIFALMVLMGFGSGLSGPSRDMLIRSVTPVGATGRVYGVVYSGLDVGLAVGPFVFGKMLDYGFYVEVFYGIAFCFCFSVATAWRVVLNAR